MDKLYEKGTTPEKRQVVSSIYPEKLQFDDFHFGTPRLNEGIQLICSLEAGFSEIKNGTPNDLSTMSHQVTDMVRSSNTLVEDLRLLERIF